MSFWKVEPSGRVLAILVVIVLVTLATVITVLSQLGFSYHNLSKTEDRSKHPDMAASSAGYWAVAAWVEEYGREVLIGGNWGDETITAFSGGASEQIGDVAVAVGPEGKVHLIYVVLDSGLGRSDIRYKTCNLPDELDCEEEASVPSASGDRITSVDVALDEHGTPHVVWASADEILYASYDGDGWSDPPREIDASSMESEHPAVAWANGAVHVAWEDASDGEIWYRRRFSGTWGPRDPLGTQGAYGPPGNPDIAARGGRVFVVWDWCTDPSCEAYFLVYRRSNDNGSSWRPLREVGTDFVVEQYFTTYPSHPAVPYMSDLQPAIALSGDCWPAVAWHADVGGEYALYHSYATTGTADLTVDWNTPTLLNTGRESAVGAIDVEGVVPGGDPYVHIAYMGKADPLWWDVYYARNGERPTPTPSDGSPTATATATDTPTPTGTSTSTPTPTLTPTPTGTGTPPLTPRAYLPLVVRD